MTPERRERVLELARAGQSCRSISAEVGLHYSTVSRICAAEGIVFERTQQTANATAARVTAMRERRIELAEATLDDLDAARDRLASVTTALELQRCAISINQLSSAHANLVKVGLLPEPRLGPEHYKSMFGQLQEQMRIFSDHILTEESEGREVTMRVQDSHWVVESHDPEAVESTEEPADAELAELRRLAGEPDV